MTISLQRFAIGDTNYIGKHNSNADAIEAAIASIDTMLSSSTGVGALSITTAYEALFGPTVAVIGASSYACSGSGTTLTVQAGYCWRPTLLQVLRKAASTSLSFAGLAAATYYVVIDSSGAPVRTADSTEAVYSVVWTGSAFGAITRLANIAWGETEWLGAQASAVLGANYATLDARLEAGEAAAIQGAAFAASAGLANGAATLDASGKLTASQVPSLSAQPYDVGGSYSGVPTASFVLIRYPFPRSVIFPSGLTNSRGVAGIAATSQSDFDLRKNGASVGTMRFAAGATTATFIMASQTTFAAGDVLTVIAPGTPDATLANIGFSLAGTR